MAKTRKKTTKKRSKSGAAGEASAAGKKLVIVESPAKAKTISRYLGGDYVVKACMGHVRDLPRKNLGVDIEAGFVPTYEPLSGKRRVLAELKKAAKNASEIYLATDLDREGEAIAWHLAESLAKPPETFRRVIFNEITAQAIREAFAHPRTIDMHKVDAQQARRVLDRIVGYKVSPLLWKKVASGLSAGRVQSVAVRLIVERERQIEAFVPEEYWRIAGVFTVDLDRAGELAEQWAELTQQSGRANGNGPTKAMLQEFLSSHRSFAAELATWRGETFKPDNLEAALEAAQALGLEVQRVERIEDPQGKGPAARPVRLESSLVKRLEFTVADLKQRQRRANPPAPFTTASLQQAAATQLRFSATRTMRVAQQLYEGVQIPGNGLVGLITYMRTDSRNLSAEAVEQTRTLISENFGKQYLPARPNVYTSGQRAQEAHEAIRPTNVARTPEQLAGALSDEQLKLYELIWRRTVCCQMKPAVWNVTEVRITTRTDAGEAVFKATGRQLAFDGYLRVAGIPSNGDQLLPDLSVGSAVAPIAIEPKQHFTQPPPRYTEASLVRTLEAEGIGRPSTYAAIIQTIQDRGYVELIDRAFRPTDLGIVVTDKLVKHFPKIFEVGFTAHMEDQLDKIEQARAGWTDVLEEFYGPFSESLRQAQEQMDRASEPSEYTCDKCGKPMVYRVNRNGRFLACSGYPQCKNTYPVDKDGKKLEAVEVDLPCPQCGKKMVLRRSRYGPFLGCSDYPKCKGTARCDENGKPLRKITEADIHETCSQCGSPMQVRWKGRRAFLGCSNYPQCKNTAPLPDGVYIEPPPKPKPKDAGVNCPKCGKPMVIRSGRRGEFLACSGYPRCRNAMDLSKLEQLKAQQAQTAAKK